ncbi:MFS transporter [Streptomyces luteoverticillatus]|uniref:MFS transporter n=1 Tax=Streptomyces luteoverticillatus TaxID=66425 RepID=A0A3Q9FW39_STRLT|nr:MFS transporter [Streptomyces luteoverticillatus]AZQ71519.1 MFS transporter [Streptomyces luteoverticillatus]
MNVWRRLLLAVVCGAAVASVYAAQPVLEPMGHDLGLSTDLSGWIVSTAQFGYIAGLLLLVPLGDVVADRRRLIAVHLAVTAVALILTASASAAWTAFLGLAAAGAFAVVVQTTVAYTASISPPGERGRNIGVVTSGVVIGILGARVVTGALADVWSWRSVYAVLAALSLGLAALVLLALPPDERPAGPSYKQTVSSLGGLFKDRLFLSRGLIAFFLFASFGTLWSGVSLPLADAPWHLSESRIGLFGVAGLAGALGAARAGRWADAGRAIPVSGFALLLLILSWAAIGQLTWALWLLVLGIVALDFAVQAVHVSNQHVLTSAHPDRLSAVIGGYMVFYSLGSALGAAATTAVFAAHGWAGSSLLGAGFAACALVVWAVSPRDSADLRSEQVTSGGNRTRCG